MNILVVEDDPDIREVIIMALLMEGWSVTGLNNGGDVPPAIQYSTPNIILMDVLLGDYNGGEICRKLKGGLTTKNIPVVIVSATFHPGRDGDCGADLYLGKPFDIDHLIGSIKQLVA